MDKEQWWALLKRLAAKHQEKSVLAISSILRAIFKSETVISESICEMVDALSTSEGDEQAQRLKRAYIALQADRPMLPHVVSLLAARFESLIEHLIEMHKLGVPKEALVNLADKALNESDNAPLREAHIVLQKIGKRLKQHVDVGSGQVEASASADTDERDNDVIQGQKNPKIERMIAEQERRARAPSEVEAPDQRSGYARPGDVIGGQDWTLIELLGRGGMGSVWRAQNHFNEMGALKLMLPHLVSNDRLIQRFQLEIRAIKKIRHSNVVELVDWGRDRLNGRERWYFVTDFIKGKSLSKRLQESKSLELEELRDMFIQIALGLHAAHAEGVIHRDIKPGNIMIRSDGSPVIIDFGIARQLEDPSMTQTHERVLTLQFASPEQLYGEPVGPQSDVFSLAATLGFCFSPDPKRQRPQFEPEKVPEAFHYVLEKSLSYKQEHRPQDMEEFADMLRQIEFKQGVVVNFPRREGLADSSGSSVESESADAGRPAPLRLQIAQSGPPPEIAALRDEVFHYHGPDGQQKLPLHQIVDLIKAHPRGRHLVWKKGWSEWRPWFKLKILKDYVQALKESQTQLQDPSAITPFSSHKIEVKGVEHTLVALPPGIFWMGNQSVDAESDEKPRHRVTLSRGFLIGQTQLTQDLYEAVLGHNPSQYKNGDHPVERVSWLDVVRWCNLLSEQQGLRPAYTIMDNGEAETPRVLWNQLCDGYRLPTEAEWEYAARAGGSFTYAGSNRPDEVAWFGSSRKRQGQRTFAVKGKQPNNWDLYDMSGNVWEWCWGDIRDYSEADETDPIGSAETGYSICRGGSNYLDARQTRCSYRMRYAISYRSLFVGFRIVRTLL